jgi:hypothetical protein
MTLAICGQWQGFGSERGFYRYPQRHLRAALPQLPTREQCNRQMRQHHEGLVAFFLPLVQLLAAQRCAYEALDSAGVPTREAKRRGTGWLPGLADMGWSNRLGWSEGFQLLLAVTPGGAMTGCGCGTASTKDQPLAETCFALRCWPQPGLPRVGAPALGPSGVDKGFAGQANQAVWQQTYGAQVICPPKRHSRMPWPQALRRWLAGAARLSTQCTTSSCILFASTGNGPMSSADFSPVERPRLPCITFVFGSMNNSAGHSWPLRTW